VNLILKGEPPAKMPGKVKGIKKKQGSVGPARGRREIGGKYRA